MKYDDRYRDAAPFEEVSFCLWRSVGASPCAVCGESTSWLDYGQGIPFALCGDECDAVFREWVRSFKKENV